jgi:serine/threonine protein kinase
LENILFDKNANVKIADFGFAVQKQIDVLKSYRGTFTYMAPEIKEGKTYHGTKVDIFSFGVILFVVTHGIFPFKEARKEEYFFNLLYTGQIQTYFNKVNGNGLSEEFRNLMLWILQYDPEKRPSLQQIRTHPWMQKPYSYEGAR